MSASRVETPKTAASAIARARLPAAMSDLEGTHPVFRHSPPILPFSISTTGTPKAAAAAATDRPPEPAPMTQMSGVKRSAMLSPRLDYYCSQSSSGRQLMHYPSVGARAPGSAPAVASPPPEEGRARRAPLVRREAPA